MNETKVPKVTVTGTFIQHQITSVNMKQSFNADLPPSERFSTRLALPRGFGCNEAHHARPVLSAGCARAREPVLPLKPGLSLRL